MIRRRRRLTAWALLVMLAGTAAAAQTSELRIGYIDRQEDPAYQEVRGYAGVFRHEHASPRPAAELAIKDGMAAARAAGLPLVLLHRPLAAAEDAGATVEALVRERVAAIVLDLPLSELERIAKLPAAASVALINARHRDEGLRLATCRTALLHTMPSWSMLTDALAQGLMTLNWRRILVLKGPAEDDALFADPFIASVKKFGLRIADTRAFVLGNDPRKRDQTNVRLLTGNADYDAIFVADMSGDFGRYVPYNTARARPVIGTTGLRPLAWHAYWERHGAPQLNRRFHRAAGRAMSEEDWATWIAVRAVLDAAVAARDASPAAVLKSLMSPDLRLELYKGLPGSFRPWSRQLRQGILLGTHDAVVALAPVDGALHQTNTLDTLGPDQPEFHCPG
jgi:ABC transporter substrate binding protein (PQQ-dependent alcohol dehydrogenase system)